VQCSEKAAKTKASKAAKASEYKQKTARYAACKGKPKPPDACENFHYVRNHDGKRRKVFDDGEGPREGLDLLATAVTRFKVDKPQPPVAAACEPGSSEESGIVIDN
jgi:hypothetical protein